MPIWDAEIFEHLNICALVRARVTGACRFIWQAPLQSYLLPTWAAPSSLLVFTKSWRLSCWRCLEKIFCSFDLDINFSPTSKLFQSLSLNNYTLSSMHDPLKSIDISLRQSYTGHVSAKGLKNCSDGHVHITYQANFPRLNLLTPSTKSEMQLFNISLKISDCRGWPGIHLKVCV